MFREEFDKLWLIQSLLQVRVKSIFDRVVCTSIKLFDHLTPADTLHKVQPDDELILLSRPLALVDLWVKVVVPSFSTLLSNTTW